MTEQRIRFRQFDEALHDSRAFSCGVDEIDQHLHNAAAGLLRNRVVTWCATRSDGAFIGFYGLASHTVEPSLAARLDRDDLFPIPTTYMTCIGVDRPHQRQGYGAVLLTDAILRTARGAAEIASAALVLDVLGEGENLQDRHRLYAQLGFEAIDPRFPDRLMLPLDNLQPA